MKKALHIGMSCIPDHHGLGLKKAFESQGWEYREIASQSLDLNFQIINVANTYNPDLIWVQIQSEGISPEAIKALKDNGGYVIGWSGDKRNILPECYFNYAKWGFDLSTFSNTEDVDIMRKCGYDADFLQIGISPDIYSNIGPVNSLAEIVFFGNTFSQFPLSGLRREMVKELKRTYSERFKAFGSGQPDGGQFMSDQRGEAAVYRGAKIGINLSHFDSDRYSSDRLFRMIGVGIMVLSHRYKGIEKDFEIGTHLDVFDDLNDLKNKINYYLQHENERKQIAFLGHKLAQEKFSFEKMGEEILNLYNKYNGN
jgi:glycosyltransferase involved in cell wall biosynthesis